MIDKIHIHGDSLMLHVFPGDSLQETIQRAYNFCRKEKIKTGFMFNGFKVTVERMRPWEWIEEE